MNKMTLRFRIWWWHLLLEGLEFLYHRGTKVIDTVQYWIQKRYLKAKDTLNPPSKIKVREAIIVERMRRPELTIPDE